MWPNSPTLKYGEPFPYYEKQGEAELFDVSELKFR